MLQLDGLHQQSSIESPDVTNHNINLHLCLFIILCVKNKENIVYKTD